MNHEYKLKNNNIILYPISECHLEMMRLYRNNKSNTKYLRKIKNISKKDQIDWYKNYLKNKKIYGFIIKENHKLKKDVGTIFIYDIEKRSAEIGKIVIGDKNAHHMGIGQQAIELLTDFGLHELSLNKIKAEVNTENISSLVSFIKAGYLIDKKEKLSNNQYQYLLYKTKRSI